MEERAAIKKKRPARLTKKNRNTNKKALFHMLLSIYKVNNKMIRYM